MAFSKPSNPYYRNVRVSSDGKWLQGGDGTIIAYGSLSEAPSERHGVSYDGLSLAMIAKDAPLNFVVLELSETPEGVAYWDDPLGPRSAKMEMNYPYPSPEQLIPDMGVRMGRMTMAQAVLSKPLAKAARACLPFRTTYLYGGEFLRGTWVIGKAGAHELRIFIPAAHVSDEGWPK